MYTYIQIDVIPGHREAIEALPPVHPDAGPDKVYIYTYIHTYIHICVCVEILMQGQTRYIYTYILYVQNISPRACEKKDFWPTLNRTSQYVSALPVQIVPSDNKT